MYSNIIYTAILLALTMNYSCTKQNDRGPYKRFKTDSMANLDCHKHGDKVYCLIEHVQLKQGPFDHVSSIENSKSNEDEKSNATNGGVNPLNAVSVESLKQDSEAKNITTGETPYPIFGYPLFYQVPPPAPPQLLPPPMFG